MLYWYRAAQDVGGGIIMTNNQVIVLLYRAEQDVGGDRKQVIVQLVYNWLEMWSSVNAVQAVVLVPGVL